VALRPIVEELRRRDALEIRFFKPSTRRKGLAEQARKAGRRVDLLDGGRYVLDGRGKWPAIVTLTVEQDRLIVQYKSGYPDRVEEIAISWTPVVVHRRLYHRPWLVCPRCGVRRQYLLYFWSYLCRRCGFDNKPVYAGDRLSHKKKWQRGLRRIYNIFGHDSDHPGCITRPRNMKRFFFYRLMREAQAREKALFFDEDRQRWRRPPTRWLTYPENRSG
jgi:hypothetical protein